MGPTKITQLSKTDRQCSEKSINFLKSFVRKRFPFLTKYDEEGSFSILKYAGLRPQNVYNSDYALRFDLVRKWATLGAIRSSGLTTSRAIALYTAKKFFPDYDQSLKLPEVEMPVPVPTHNGQWNIGKYSFSPTHLISRLGLENYSNKRKPHASSL